MQDPEALPHRLDRRTHPLERQGLPRREERHLVAAENRGDIGDEAVRLHPGRGDHQDGPPVRRRGETGQGEGAAGLWNRPHRVASAQHGGEGRLLRQKWAQGAEIRDRVGGRGTIGHPVPFRTR